MKALDYLCSMVLWEIALKPVTLISTIKILADSGFSHNFKNIELIRKVGETQKDLRSIQCGRFLVRMEKISSI